jgi:hypothetical protein
LGITNLASPSNKGYSQQCSKQNLFHKTVFLMIDFFATLPV